MISISEISIKGATKLAVYASALKVILYSYGFLSWGFLNNNEMLALVSWVAIFIFFFTLYKNMQ